MLYGGGTGIATLAVLVAAAFWTWLWGPIGLFLSTPLTVCLVVMGKYVPQLGFLTILLGDEPALSPPDRVYQRLLAGDPEEATDLVHEYARTMPLEQLYDEVLVPTLYLSEQDEMMDPKRQAAIRAGVRDIVDELGDVHRAELAVAEAKGQTPGAAKSALAAPPAGSRVPLPKACVVTVAVLPANDQADEVSARMFAQLLEVRGYCTTVMSPDHLASEMVAAVEAMRADAVVVSSLPPAAVTHARYLCKRLHGTLPGIEMVVGLWQYAGDAARAKDRIAPVRTVQVATTLRQALVQVHQMVQPKLLAAGKADAVKA